jgi:hypothetical protein
MNLGTISKDFDKFAAVIIAALSVVVLAYGVMAVSRGSGANNTYYFIFGGLTLVSCLIWLRVRKIDALQDLETPPSHLLFLLGNVLFFLFLGGVILSLQLRADVYVRPLTYFVFAAYMAGALALEVLTSDAGAKRVWLVLTQIIILGCTLQFSELILFPNVVGDDPWAHEQFTLQLIHSGHVPQLGQYATLPSFHLAVASTSLLSGLDYKWSAMLSVELSLIITCTLFIFLIGKSVISAKAGLLGGLLLVTANQFIFMGFWTIPTTFGGIMLVMAVYMVLKSRKEQGPANLIIIFVAMAALITAHTISAVAFAVALISGLVAMLLWHRLRRPTVRDRFWHMLRRPAVEDSNLLSIRVAEIFIVGMFAWWLLVSGSLAAVVALIQSQNADVFTQITSINIPNMPLWLQGLSAVGFCAFVALALIGCLYMISQKFGTKSGFVLVFIGVIPVLLGFSRAFGVFLVAERWIFFAQILYAVPLAVTALILVARFRGTGAKALFLASAVALLAFVMIVSPTANIDNHLFGSSTWERHTLTSSEITAVQTVGQKSGGDIFSDEMYVRDAYYYYNGSVLQSARDLQAGSSLLLIRAVNDGLSFHVTSLHNPDSIPYQTTFTPPNGAGTSLGSKVYDSGSVAGYANNARANELSVH